MSQPSKRFVSSRSVASPPAHTEAMISRTAAITVSSGPDGRGSTSERSPS